MLRSNQQIVFPDGILTFEDKKDDVLTNVKVVFTRDIYDMPKDLSSEIARVAIRNSVIKLDLNNISYIEKNGEPAKQDSYSMSMYNQKYHQAAIDTRKASSVICVSKGERAVFNLWGRDHLVHVFAKDKSESGKNNEFGVIMSVGERDLGERVSEVDIKSSGVYLVSSCPLNGIRRAQHLARPVYNGDSVSFASKTIVGNEILEVNEKTSREILKMVRSVPDAVGKFSRGVKVYLIASGASGTDHEVDNGSPSYENPNIYWNLDKLAYRGNFSYDEKSAREGVSLAVVGDFVFRDQYSERKRMNFISVVNYAPPFFKEIEGYWDIPSEGKIFGFNDGWIFKADSPFIYDDRNKVTHYASTAVLDGNRKILLDGPGGKNIIEIRGDKIPSVLYKHDGVEEILVRSTRYNK
jgi:hypothetical protein